MDTSNIPIQEFQLDLTQLTYTGQDLARPESILAQPDGTLWISDGRGGITRINHDGSQKFLGGLGGEANGLAMLADGSLLIANIAGGAVQRMYPDGYIVLVDEKGPRIVGDGIYFTNEIRLDAKEEFLYVAETMGQHILRFRVQPDGNLVEKEIFGPSSLGTASVVDGFTFDADGNIWVTTVLRNGVGIITTKGDYHVVFEDARTEQLESFEEKLITHTAEPLDMLLAAGSTLQLVTSVTFGGPDLRTVYIGSLGMNRLPTFRSPVPGLPMRHWR